jgi:hypothetical protein
MKRDGKRRRVPAPLVVAERCMARAWDDDVDDRTRRLLEMAHDTIHRLASRVVKLAAFSERAEARS